MQSADFEDDLYKNWFRRPTLFAACGWFLLAVAGRIIVKMALGEFALGLMLRFGVRSLIAMVLLSLMIDHLPLPPATDDMLLASVYGGAISGIGFGLVMRGSATTGGTDMLASLAHRLIPVLRVSYAIFLFDGLIIIASAFALLIT